MHLWRQVFEWSKNRRHTNNDLIKFPYSVVIKELNIKLRKRNGTAKY